MSVADISIKKMDPTRIVMVVRMCDGEQVGRK
jgi:hypothetical protein